jgi:hypothetical protein
MQNNEQIRNWLMLTDYVVMVLFPFAQRFSHWFLHRLERPLSAGGAGGQSLA